jgi:hypothetical protein
MNLTMLIIDSLLVLGMVGVSLYGASALPPGRGYLSTSAPFRLTTGSPRTSDLTCGPRAAL